MKMLQSVSLGIVVVAMLCCVGCGHEKVVYVPVDTSENAARSRANVQINSRIINILGLSNDYFISSPAFAGGRVPYRSKEVKLQTPFGPLDTAFITLTQQTPCVVDVTSSDRTSATGQASRVFLEGVTLKRTYDKSVTAENLREEFMLVVKLLNETFGTQIGTLDLAAVYLLDDLPKNVEAIASRKVMFNRLQNEGAPALFVNIELVGQSVSLSAFEPVYCKRNGELLLKYPARLNMEVRMSQWLNNELRESEQGKKVEPVCLGSSNTNSFWGAFTTDNGSYYSNDNYRQPSRYEYNVDTKMMKHTRERETASRFSGLRQRRLLQRANPVIEPDLSSEFKPMLPVDSFGLFTVGKCVTQNTNVTWKKSASSFNSEYITNINGRVFTVMVCKRDGVGSAVTSVSARPDVLFDTREEALPFYEMFKKYLIENWKSDMGELPQEHPKFARDGSKLEGELVCSWYSPENVNVEISVRLCHMKNFKAKCDDGEGEKWYVGLFLKDIYSYRKSDYREHSYTGSLRRVGQSQNSASQGL